MLTYIKGNLVDAYLEGTIDCIGHQANCFHTFGSGIAREIRECIPEAYAADLKTVKGDKNKLGNLSYHIEHNVDHMPSAVFNLYGQFDFGGGECHTDYKALTTALRKMRYTIEVMEAVCDDTLTVGFPKIGCGLGGGDWGIVSTIIQGVFGDREVFIYEL